MKASFAYDADYDPAAPVMVIGLGPSGAELPRQVLTAFVDTGADATMIPAPLLAEAGCRYVEQRRLRGILGEARVVNLYLASVHIAGVVIHGIRAVAARDTTEAILGRDVLSQLEIVLNGPAQELWLP